MSSGGRVQGVVLQDGSEVRSKVVLSSASPHITFLKLTPQVRLGVEVRCLPGVGMWRDEGDQGCIRVGDVSAKSLRMWGNVSSLLT